MTQSSLVIQNARCITPDENEQLCEKVCDILIKDGVIKDLGTGLKGDTYLDADGLHVLPGLIDTQVHLREPGLEHKETIKTGFMGAALGGLTGVFEMPNTTPPTDTPERLQQKLDIAASNPWVNYAFFIGATPENIQQLEQLESLPGCCGVKIFMGSSTGSLLIDSLELLDQALQKGKRRVAVHCEDEALLKKRYTELNIEQSDVFSHPLWRNEEVALTATKNLVETAKKHQRKVHVLHITTKEEMAYLYDQKSNFPLLTVETTPQHLTLFAPDCYEKLGTKAQMNPPIRTKDHQDGLWDGVNNGTVDVLGSDHAPHTLEEKARPYPKSPSGMTGVQTIVPLMLDHVNNGRLSLIRLVELMAEKPCEIYGIKNKGKIKVGYDGDFTLVDLNKEMEIKNEDVVSISGWTPFDGKQVKGVAVATIIKGQIVMKDGQLHSPQGKAFMFE